MHTQTLRDAITGISPMPAHELDRMELGLTERTLGKGEPFVQIGQVCTTIGFVTDGSMRAYYLHKGEEIHLEFFLRHQFVTSYRSFITAAPSRLCVEAVQETTLLVLGYDTVQAGYLRSPHWERFGRLICERIYTDAQDRIERLLLDSAEERYLNLIAAQPTIFNHVPLYQIASYLGIRPPSLSRIRRRVAQRAAHEGRGRHGDHGGR